MFYKCQQLTNDNSQSQIENMDFELFMSHSPLHELFSAQTADLESILHGLVSVVLHPLLRM